MNFRLILLFLLPAAVLVIVCVIQRFRIVRLRKCLNTQNRSAAETSTFLSLFSLNLKSGENLSDWMNVTARYVAERIDARSVCIFLRNGDFYKAAGFAGLFPLIRKSLSQNYVISKNKYLMEQLRLETFRPGEGILGEVAQTRRELILNHAMEDPRILGYEPVIPVDCVMAVPLLSEGNVTGVMCAVNNSDSRQESFSMDQIARFKGIANHVVLAQSIMEGYAMQTEQQRISQELSFARKFQKSLLPKSIPLWGSFSVQAFSRPSKEVSGDFYDFVELDQDRLLVVIGDACGKGIPACMVMAMTRSYIRANIEHFTSLKDFLFGLNDNLYRDTGDERYITLACCILDRHDMTFEYARAGHTELMLYIRNHMRTFYPDGSGIGLMPGEFTSFDTFCMSFTPGMTAFLFTDGINEATDAEFHKEEYGITRLRKLFKGECEEKKSTDEMFADMIGAIDHFSGNEDGGSQEDDQTMVIIRHI